LQPALRWRPAASAIWSTTTRRWRCSSSATRRCRRRFPYPAHPRRSAPASAPASSAAPAEIPIDFAAAQQQNPDIYAWLRIPGTAVDYPILRRADDDNYYLDHNLDGSAGYPGCLYTQSCDAADFSDFNTVVYGHNMKNGTMFGGLKQYRDGDYLAAHRQIIVYTPTEKRVYTIFAAVVYSDAYLPARYDDTLRPGTGRRFSIRCATRTA
jgi:hypothetical protein